MRDNNNPFIICPDCLHNRAKLKGILCDFFPEERLKVNVILAAFDEGIVDTIQGAVDLDNILAGRLIKVLVSDYGINEDKARFSAEYWFKQYGADVLEKPYSLHFEEAQPEQPKKQISPQSKPHASLVPTTGVISVKKMQEKEKLPKDIIQRGIADEQALGITDFRCAIVKDYSSDRYCTFKITGEYTGKVSQYLLIMFMAYNANNELIEADFGYKIDNDFKGHKTFSMSLHIPNDEYISKIIMKIVPDPVFA